MPDHYKWVVYAVLGAFFAAVVQLASKPAVDRIDTSLVNLLRVAVMAAMFAGVIAWERTWAGLARAPAYAVGMALASGAAAGLSWFFGYRALKLASVSQSYPIDKLSVVFAVVLSAALLGDRPTAWNWLGIAAMTGGAVLVTLPRG